MQVRNANIMRWSVCLCVGCVCVWVGKTTYAITLKHTLRKKCWNDVDFPYVLRFWHLPPWGGVFLSYLMWLTKSTSRVIWLLYESPDSAQTLCARCVLVIPPPTDLSVPPPVVNGHSLDSYNEVCKGLTKCWSSKNHLVVSSEFWNSVQSWCN